MERLQTMTQLCTENKAQQSPYDFTNQIIEPKDRKILHERIEKRFDLMLAQGLIDEVKKLYDRSDLTADLPSLRSVGYRQVWDYLAGNIDKKTMREKAIIATRQLAKRQLTWLRGMDKSSQC